MKQQKFNFSAEELRNNISDFEQAVQESQEDKNYIIRSYYELIKQEQEPDVQAFVNSVLFHEETQIKSEKWLDILTTVDSYRSFLGENVVRIEWGIPDESGVPPYALVSKLDKSMQVLLNQINTGVAQ